MLFMGTIPTLNPRDVTQRAHDAITTSLLRQTTWRRRFDVLIALLLRLVPTGNVIVNVFPPFFQDYFTDTEVSVALPQCQSSKHSSSQYGYIANICLLTNSC